MGKKILKVLMVMALIISLPVFSYADLPSNYTELEYIQSSGTQYINSGVFPSSELHVVADVRFTSAPSSDSAIFGTRDSNSNQFWVYYRPTNDSYSFRYGSSSTNNLIAANPTDRLTLDANENVFSIGSDSVTASSASFSDDFNPLYIFCVDNDLAPQYYSSIQLYSLKIYVNDTLVRDFIPCSNASNVVGLWDDVNDVFYDNDGSGSFIPGPVATPPVPEYSISVITDGNGSASSDLSVATAGTTVTLSVSPNDGYEFSEWQVLQGDIDIVNNQFIMPSSDVSVKAVFVPDGYYSVAVENDGNGTGSANPVRAEQGTRVTLSAVPVLGYEFDSWEVVSGAVNISNNQFIMPDSDVVVRAKFKPIVYTITLNQGSNGSATVSQTTGIIGDVITLTATPDDLYSFSHWDVTQGGITVENNQFVMPASDVVLTPVFVEQSAISSGFEYHSGAISGEEESEFALIDVDFGEQPAGEYLINIYHWGSGCIPTFQIEYNGKYLPFSTTGGVSTVAIEHDGGSLVLDGSLDLVKNLLQTAEGTIVWAGEYGNGNLQYHSVSSWTFNIEDVVLIPSGLSHVEDYGVYSSIVSFLRDKFDDLISVFGSEESEADVNEAADELNKEVEDLNNLSGQLDEQKNDLEQQFNSDFKISDELSGQTDNIQLIYTGLFDALGIFSIFIWLPILFAVIKKLLRL